MKNDLWMLKYARDFLVFTAILFRLCMCMLCVLRVSGCFEAPRHLSEALLGSSLSMLCESNRRLFV